MIRNTDLDKRLRRQRLDAKTAHSQFRQAIEAGANISPFVSNAILKIAQEVYRIDTDAENNQLDAGRNEQARRHQHRQKSKINGVAQPPVGAFGNQRIRAHIAGSGSKRPNEQGRAEWCKNLGAGQLIQPGMERTAAHGSSHHHRGERL